MGDCGLYKRVCWFYENRKAALASQLRHEFFVIDLKLGPAYKLSRTFMWVGYFIHAFRRPLVSPGMTDVQLIKFTGVNGIGDCDEPVFE